MWIPERSEAAQRKARNRCTDDSLPVHSFRSLLADLATVTRNVMAMDGAPEASFVLYPQLTPVQDRAFQLLDLRDSRLGSLCATIPYPSW